MNKNTFIKPALLGAAALAAGTAAHAQGKAAQGAKPKNVLMIMADDLGSAELGCYGNKVHKTPNLDAMAKSGVLFNTFFATPVSTPSRVALMTGKYGIHTGHLNMSNLPGGKGKYDLSKDEYTFGQMFKDAGYTTAMAGKWQLGGKGSTFIFECGFDEYLAWIYKGNLADGVKYQASYWPAKSTKTSRYWHPGVMKNGEHIKTSDKDYGPDMYSTFIADFIKKNARADKPFFAYYPMCLTHSPWLGTPDNPNVKEGTPEALKANVEYCDKIVGRLLKTLDDLGIRENTLVVFIGDNGTQFAGKTTVTEWGPHTPCMVSCPGTVQKGVVSGEMADITDILPTLVEYAGFQPRNHASLDGKSLLPYLTGKTKTTKEYAITYYGNFRIVRNKEWLLESNRDESFGDMYRCGNSRNGRDYKLVTDFKDPAAAKAKAGFEKFIKDNWVKLNMSDNDKMNFTTFVMKNNKKLQEVLGKKYPGQIAPRNLIFWDGSSSIPQDNSKKKRENDED